MDKADYEMMWILYRCVSHVCFIVLLSRFILNFYVLVGLSVVIIFAWDCCMKVVVL